MSPGPVDRFGHCGQVDIPFLSCWLWDDSQFTRQGKQENCSERQAEGFFHEVGDLGDEGSAEPTLCLGLEFDIFQTLKIFVLSPYDGLFKYSGGVYQAVGHR